MKVVDRYGTKDHFEELHFQVSSRPLGRATSRVIKTIVKLAGSSAKSMLLDYLTSKYAPARRAAAELLSKMHLDQEDVTRLLMLSRERKSDIRRKVVGLLGHIKTPEV